MNPLVELNLALILFLPWYLLVGWIFWRWRGQKQSDARKLLVALVISGALAAAAVSGIWAYRYADPSVGAIWKQILACVIGYWAFLSVLVAGFFALRPPRGSAAKTAAKTAVH